MNRFVALDSWRGICACLVCFFHFGFTNSHVYYLDLVRNSYLFVDFFFVLSGFIIACSYQARLGAEITIWRFMLLRLGRVYPLHIFTLSILIIIKALIPDIGGVEEFPGSNNIAIITNILLIHGLGVHHINTWNAPSWSISVEFYTYLIFAVSVVAFKRLALPLLGAAMVVSPFVLFALGTHGMDTTQDFGIIRCVYGFVAGVFCFNIYKRLEAKGARQITKVNTLLEVVSVICSIIFVQYAGRGALTFIAPLIFGFLVIVFAQERGLISRALYSRPLVFLGSLSYSIYMVHYFIQDGLRDGGLLLEKLLYIHICTNVYLYDGGLVLGKPLLGAELWQGDLACVIMLLCVITISCLTYRFVEEPGRVCFRHIAKKYSKLAVLPAQSQPTSAAPVAH